MHRQGLLVELGLLDRSGGTLDAEADEVGGGDIAGAHRAGADLPLSLLGLRASFPRLRTGLRAAARSRRGVPPMPETGQLELPDEPV